MAFRAIIMQSETRIENAGFRSIIVSDWNVNRYFSYRPSDRNYSFLFFLPGMYDVRESGVGFQEIDCESL